MDAKELRSLLHYNPKTGKFTWKISHKGTRGKGAIAGGYDDRKYVLISLNYKRYYAHRLAWLYVHNVWPQEIDHINGNRWDNRLVNLRLATRSQNTANAGPRTNGTSGIKGVSWQPDRKKWYAHIRVNYRKINLGRYTSKKEAKAAYNAAAKKFFGAYAR